MSAEGYPQAPSPAEAVNGKGFRVSFPPLARTRPRYWLHALLLLLTLLTTSAVGARLSYNFHNNLPAVDVAQDLAEYSRLIADPSALLAGLPFSLTLLAILLAHELGHYLACTHYGLDASMPYFLPAPTVIGTLGAFIRIRSPIYSKRVLFDVGIAGPVAGFLFLLPALTIGLAYSKVIPGIAARGDLIFGTPAIVRLFQYLIFPGVASPDIYLHPIARAAWVGIFATALNLLPIGQLDGGHILYAFFPERHRLLSKLFILGLIPLAGFFWPWWLLWAGLLFFFALKHPVIYDPRPLGGVRERLGWLALVIFILSFMPTPLETAPGL